MTYEVEGHVQRHGHEEAVHDHEGQEPKAQILPVPRLEVGPLRVHARMRNGRLQTRVPQILVVGLLKTRHADGAREAQRELEAEDDDHCAVRDAIELREFYWSFPHVLR